MEIASIVAIASIVSIVTIVSIATIVTITKKAVQICTAFYIPLKKSNYIANTCFAYSLSGSRACSF